MHVYAWRHSFLIPEIQQTAPLKITNYLRSILNYGGRTLAAKYLCPISKT